MLPWILAYFFFSLSTTLMFHKTFRWFHDYEVEEHLYFKHLLFILFMGFCPGVNIITFLLLGCASLDKLANFIDEIWTDFKNYMENKRF